jgi:hypothetical protein
MSKSKLLSDDSNQDSPSTPNSAAIAGDVPVDEMPPASAASPQSVPSESADAPAEVPVLRSQSSLSITQCRALENLMCGQSMSQAARGAGGVVRRSIAG